MRSPPGSEPVAVFRSWVAGAPGAVALGAIGCVCLPLAILGVSVAAFSIGEALLARVEVPADLGAAILAILTLGAPITACTAIGLWLRRSRRREVRVDAHGLEIVDAPGRIDRWPIERIGGLQWGSLGSRVFDVTGRARRLGVSPRFGAWRSALESGIAPALAVRFRARLAAGETIRFPLPRALRLAAGWSSLAFGIAWFADAVWSEATRGLLPVDSVLSGIAFLALGRVILAATRRRSRGLVATARGLAEIGGGVELPWKDLVVERIDEDGIRLGSRFGAGGPIELAPATRDLPVLISLVEEDAG